MEADAEAATAVCIGRSVVATPSKSKPSIRSQELWRTERENPLACQTESEAALHGLLREPELLSYPLRFDCELLGNREDVTGLQCKQ